MKISNGKWCWFSRGIGGKSALDYLIKVKELSFVEAVEQIVGQAAVRSPVFHKLEIKTQEKKLILLGKNDIVRKIRPADLHQSIGEIGNNNRNSMPICICIYRKKYVEIWNKLAYNNYTVLKVIAIMRSW